MIDNVVLVSDTHHSDSVIYIHISVLFLILFPFIWLLQNIEQSSLCHTVGPCWSSDLIISSLCMSIPNSKSVLPQPFPDPGNLKFIL